MKTDRCICPRCGRKLIALASRGGDSSARRVISHKDRETGDVCSGSRRELTGMDSRGYWIESTTEAR